MYKHEDKQGELTRLEHLIFRGGDYLENPQYKDYLDLLANINEIQGLYLMKFSKSKGFDPNYIWIDEDFEEVKKLAKKIGAEEVVKIYSRKYWKREHYNELYEAESIPEMVKVALKVINSTEDDLEMICGPLSTGGLGSFKANAAAFNHAVRYLSKTRNIFDQTVFEPFFQKTCSVDSPDYLKNYPSAILTDFYFKVFESGRIKCLNFLPVWESSKGACMEHDKAEELGIGIRYSTWQEAGIKIPEATDGEAVK